MLQKKFIIILFTCFYDVSVSNAQDSSTPSTPEPNSGSDINYPTLSNDWSYCYEFTWLGPDFNNVTGYNGTCDDYLEEYNVRGKIPCIPPIVISNNSHYPDMDYLWENYKASVVCRRSENQACVKHTYFYNGAINNQSHMCAKVQQEGKGPLNSGCYKQKAGVYEVELCVCTNGPGLFQKPCNSAFEMFDRVIVTVILLLCLFGIYFWS